MRRATIPPGAFVPVMLSEKKPSGLTPEGFSINEEQLVDQAAEGFLTQYPFGEEDRTSFPFNTGSTSKAVSSLR